MQRPSGLGDATRLCYLLFAILELLRFEIVFAPGSERRESYPFLVEYMNKTRTNPKVDRAALRQAADSADGRSYILAGLQTSKNDCLGTEHLSSNNSSFDWAVTCAL